MGADIWDAHKDILMSDMSVNGLTGWAAATPEQHEGRQQAHTDAEAKCVRERGGRLAKSSRDVVDFVGNMQMPKWSDGNKEAVEAYAIELRHQLGYYMQHRVKYPPAVEEHIRYEAPPPAKDPNAEA